MSNPSEGNIDAPAWEVFKENAQPLKRGRDAKRLGLKLAAGPLPTEAAEKESASKEAEFEAAVAPEALADAPDPLGVWIRYINWEREEHPSGSKSIELMERCTRGFNHDPRFRNDERLVKVWIGYADQMANPGDIFKFLHKNKIGAKVALFWVAWAFVAEKGGQDKFADKLYAKGLEQGAAPKELLASRRKQFQRRMARRWINQQAEEGVASGSAAGSAGKNIDEASLLATAAAEALAAPSSSQSASVMDENGQRRALGSVSHAAAGTVGARRPAQSTQGGSAALVNGSSAHPTTSSSGAGAGTTSTAPNGNCQHNNVSGFQIFADTTPAAPFAFLDDANNQASGAWGDLAPLEERIKENTDRARRWNDPEVVSSLKQQGSSSSSRHRSSNNNTSSSSANGVTMRARPIPVVAQRAVAPGLVFVEETFQTKQAQQQQDEDGGGSGSGGGGRGGRGGGDNEAVQSKLSVRAVLDCPQSKAEVLAADPLSFFQNKEDKKKKDGDDDDHGGGELKNKKKGKAKVKKQPLAAADHTASSSPPSALSSAPVPEQVVPAPVPTAPTAAAAVVLEVAAEVPTPPAPAAAAAVSSVAIKASEQCPPPVFDFPCGFDHKLVAPFSGDNRRSEGGKGSAAAAAAAKTSLVREQFMGSECSFEERRAVAWAKQKSLQADKEEDKDGGSSINVSMEDASPAPAAAAAAHRGGAVAAPASFQIFSDNSDENKPPPPAAALSSKVSFAIFSDDAAPPAAPAPAPVAPTPAPSRRNGGGLRHSAAAPAIMPTPVAPTPAPPRRVVGAMTAVKDMMRNKAVDEDVTINTATAMKAMRDIFGATGDAGDGGDGASDGGGGGGGMMMAHGGGGGADFYSSIVDCGNDAGGDDDDTGESSFGKGGSRLGPLNFSCAKATPFDKKCRQLKPVTGSDHSSSDDDNDKINGGGGGNAKKTAAMPFACLDDYAAAMAPPPRAMAFEADDDEEEEEEEVNIVGGGAISTPPRFPRRAFGDNVSAAAPAHPAFEIFQEDEAAAAAALPTNAAAVVVPAVAAAPFTIFSDGAATKQEKEKDHHEDGENMEPDLSSRLPFNPARRLLSDVREGDVLKPLNSSHPVDDKSANEGEEGEEGPMPEESEIYRHMCGRPSPGESGGGGDDGESGAVGLSSSSSSSMGGARQTGGGCGGELAGTGHLDEVVQRGGLFNFAIYEDSQEDDDVDNTHRKSEAVGDNHQSKMGSEQPGSGVNLGRGGSSGRGRGRGSDSSAASGDGSGGDGSGGGGGEHTVHPAELTKLATEAGLALRVHLHGASGVAGVGRRETIDGGACAIDEMLSDILGVEASKGSGGSGGAGGGDDTLELCSVLPAPPTLKTLPQGVASPSWSRRETADPDDLMSLLLEFQADDEKEAAAAKKEEEKATAGSSNGVIDRPKAVASQAAASSTPLPFAIFCDN